MDEPQALEALAELQKLHRFVRGTRGSKLSLKATVEVAATREEYTAKAVVDSGCEGSCINRMYVAQNKIPTFCLPIPIPVYNADGQPNSNGPIIEMAILFLKCGNHTERIELGVTNLRVVDLYLGHDWLKLHNPSIDWQQGLIEFGRCPPQCQPVLQELCTDPDYEDGVTTAPIVLEDGDHLLMIDPTPAVHIWSKGMISTELAARTAAKMTKRTFDEMVPEYLHDFRDVFEKRDFDKLPPSRPWDHAIELLPGLEPVLNCKIYPLSRDEQEQLDIWLEEYLKTERIRPSKSPMASPFFFVKKKDGKPYTGLPKT
jgi:hypothetical protein